MRLFKKSRKFISYWLLSEGIKSLYKSIKRRYNTTPNKSSSSDFETWAATLRQRNTTFQNKHSGSRCFILATGPSLNHQNLKPLAGELCIGVSFFFLHPDAKFIQPEYHVCAPNHAPFDFELTQKYITGLEAAYSHNYKLFYGYTPYQYSCLEYLNNKANKSVSDAFHIIDYTQQRQLYENTFSDASLWDISGNPFAMRTVIYGAIQLAAYLGCSEIILVGCDHDYLKDTTRYSNHFYVEKNGNDKDAVHLNNFNTEKWFFEYYSRWRDYRIMQSYLQFKNIQIINATHGGLLDVFPRKTLDSLLK